MINRSALVVFDNSCPDNQFVVTFTFASFWSVCKVTGEPDQAVVTIEYSPKKHSLENKGLQTYLLSYRDHSDVMENVAPLILNDLVEAVKPDWMRVQIESVAQDGLKCRIVSEWVAKDVRTPVGEVGNVG